MQEKKKEKERDSSRLLATQRVFCVVGTLLVSDIYLNVLPAHQLLLILKMCRGLSSKLGFSFSPEEFDNITETRGGLWNSRNWNSNRILNVAKKNKSIQIFVYQIDCIYEL